MYRPITIPELSLLSHRELVINPSHKCSYELLLLRPTPPSDNIRSHLHNHKRANAKNSLRCTILHRNFWIEKDLNRLFRYIKIQPEREVLRIKAK